MDRTFCVRSVRNRWGAWVRARAYVIFAMESIARVLFTVSGRGISTSRVRECLVN